MTSKRILPHFVATTVFQHSPDKTERWYWSFTTEYERALTATGIRGVLDRATGSFRTEDAARNDSQLYFSDRDYDQSFVYK